ncbi:MAG: hypothetical protein IPP01_06920 [Saprospiraceae bacterium]|nr:hypothetical protein [Saprospiraceae bacterium]
MALLTIINDILDVSKLENKKLELVTVTTNVTRLCKDIIQLFKIEANNKNLTLNLKIFKEKEDLFILIDENRLRQIIINILGNALKFTHNGSVTLNINLNEGKTSLSFKSLILELEFQKRILRDYLTDSFNLRTPKQKI